jgi:hypothetical protein
MRFPLWLPFLYRHPVQVPCLLYSALVERFPPLFARLSSRDFLYSHGSHSAYPGGHHPPPQARQIAGTAEGASASALRLRSPVGELAFAAGPLPHFSALPSVARPLPYSVSGETGARRDDVGCLLGRAKGGPTARMSVLILDRRGDASSYGQGHAPRTSPDRALPHPGPPSSDTEELHAHPGRQ